MLSKLLKHEFRATGRRMLPVLGVLTLLGLMANLSIRLLGSGFQGTLLNILLVLFIVAFFIGMIVAWVMSLVVMISRFYNNLLKDEGYLSFTLPVSTHELIWSKLIVSTVWFLATSLLIALLFGLTIFNTFHVLAAVDLEELSFFGIGDLLELLRAHGVTNGSLILLLTEMILSSVITCLATSLHFYAAMGIGQMSDTHKGLWSVLAFIGISIFFQILSATVFNGLVNSGSAEVFLGSVEDLMMTAPGAVRVMNTSMGGTMLIELLQGALLYAVTALTLKRKLNLA